MNKLQIVSTYAAVMFALAIITLGQDVKSKDSVDVKYKVGQKWSYSARPGEEGSYLIIVKIDSDPKLGRIIHIAMRGLKMKNQRRPDGISESVNHMPFSEEALEKSGLKLVADRVALPNYIEGYR